MLLVRQYRAAVGRELLEAPAGKRDVDGEPPEETGRRELEEEVGYTAARMILLAEAFTSPGFCDEYAYIYAALDLTPLATARAATAEEAAMTVERVSLSDVDDLIARARAGGRHHDHRRCSSRAPSCAIGAEEPVMPAVTSDALDEQLAEHATWLAVERGLRPNTLTAYARDLADYARFLRRRGIHDPRDVDEACVRAFVEERAASGDTRRPTGGGERRAGARVRPLVPPLLRRRGERRRRPDRRRPRPDASLRASRRR